MRFDATHFKRAKERENTGICICLLNALFKSEFLGLGIGSISQELNFSEFSIRDITEVCIFFRVMPIQREWHYIDRQANREAVDQMLPPVL